MNYMSNNHSINHGNEYVFVIVDIFSKMAILTSHKKSIIAETTTKLFFEKAWVHFGVPKTIISDYDSHKNILVEHLVIYGT